MCNGCRKKMNFSMELRSRRSKSRTPVKTVIETHSQDAENHISVTKTVTKTYSTKTIHSDAYPTETIEHNMNNIDQISKFGEKPQNQRSFQNDEVTSTNMINQNIINQTFEDSPNSFSSTGSNVSALDFYRAAGEYWNKYPKTDYTYSVNSLDRKEIAPGIIAMPNMSRRSLHNYNSDSKGHYTFSNKYIATESFLQDEVDFSTKTKSWLTDATQLQPRTLFSKTFQGNSLKHTTVSSNSLFRKIKTVFNNVLVTTLTFFYFIYTIQNSIFMWMGKKIHKAATHIMLWDTWLLQSSAGRKGKLNMILALCFIPLLLFGGWWLFNGLGPVLYGTESGKVETFSIKPVEISNYDPLAQGHIEQNVKIVTDQTAALLSSAQLQDIAKLLENPVIQDILNNREYDKLNEDSVLNDLKGNILKIQLELQNLEKSKNQELHILAAQLRTENAEKVAQLTYQLNRCCRSSYTQIENHVIRILKDLLGAPTYLATPQDISKWLHSVFVAKHDLEMQLNNLTHYLQSDYNMLIENNAELIMERTMNRVSSN